ncbi:hypothetical protein F3Y22_tig00110160pilonHSYRG00202 [Hibiscus syriacus]|uniref:Elongator complex protein 4 n=1 Tax=Hibiscus syriacus TaxID=106335 RepID=A0A6A3BHQ2_HIBSY|nr:hypothetical protein F3Y22_tig00110160pilonHSYRG00202 [Hibiscus syriacus]
MVIELDNGLFALLVHDPLIYPDEPEGSHLLDKAKTEGGTEDDAATLCVLFLNVATAMAMTKIWRSSFSRNLSTASPFLGPRLMCGPNGMIFLSSGIHDLDIFFVMQRLGGGFPLGSLVMVMEDAETPHHMLLLRNFMAQGLVHGQPLLYASTSRDPRGFLGTLPSPAVSKDDKSGNLIQIRL